MKKRIVTIALVIALLATCFAGTYAYLKDSQAVVNTFTTGNVYITLTEPNAPAQNAYHLIPNKSYPKDPTITLKAGSEDAYVAAKVIVTGTSDLSALIPMDGASGLLDINKVLSGGLLDQKGGSHGTYNGLNVFQNDNYAVYQVANGNNTWTLYIFMKNAQAAGTVTTLFTTLNTLPQWDNAEMDMIRGMKIEVQAFATQAHGFVDCYQAMINAFATDFPFAQNP